MFLGGDITWLPVGNLSSAERAPHLVVVTGVIETRAGQRNIGDNVVYRPVVKSLQAKRIHPQILQ